MEAGHEETWTTAPRILIFQQILPDLIQPGFHVIFPDQLGHLTLDPLNVCETKLVREMCELLKK